MKPPVEAPRSRQSLPLGSTPSASRACASFSPAARDESRRPLDLERDVVADLLPRLVEPGHEACEHERLRLRPALGEPALHEHDVEALLGHGETMPIVTTVTEAIRIGARPFRARAACRARVADRRERLRRRRVPPLLGGALAERGRARGARLRARRAPGQARSRDRLRARSAVARRSASRRGRRGDRLVTRRDRAPRAERVTQRAAGDRGAGRLARRRRDRLAWPVRPRRWRPTCSTRRGTPRRSSTLLVDARSARARSPTPGDGTRPGSSTPYVQTAGRSTTVADARIPQGGIHRLSSRQAVLTASESTISPSTDVSASIASSRSCARRAASAATTRAPSAPSSEA